MVVNNNFLSPGQPNIRRSQSHSFLGENGLVLPIEFILASDASAIIEHTKKVLYLEDDDIAHIEDGGKYFYKIIYPHYIFRFTYSSSSS